MGVQAERDFRRDPEARVDLCSIGFIGAAAGFVLENLTTDEDGLKSAELTGVMAGAATGVVFSLVVIPLLWPSKSAQAAP